MDRLIAQARKKMDHSVEATSHEFAGIRTGRATPALIEHLKVEAYGDTYPLAQLATISAPEPRLLTIAPFDRATMKDIERAILTSDLGLTPHSDGQVIRLQIPQLTQERRQELSKVVRKKSEEGKVAVRNVRREAIEGVRKMEKNEGLSADEVKRGEAELQELTDEHVRKLDRLTESKVEEIMEV